jgi:hypothetical protein
VLSDEIFQLLLKRNIENDLQPLTCRQVLQVLANTCGFQSASSPDIKFQQVAHKFSFRPVLQIFRLRRRPGKKLYKFYHDLPPTAATDIQQCATVLGAFRLLRLSWDEVWGIMPRAVQRGLGRKRQRVLP